MGLDGKRAVEVVRQLFFKFVAKHMFRNLKRVNSASGLHYSHTTQYLRKFNTASINP